MRAITQVRYARKMGFSSQNSLLFRDNATLCGWKVMFGIGRKDMADYEAR
jgi:hypothetical protein